MEKHHKEIDIMQTSKPVKKQKTHPVSLPMTNEYGTYEMRMATSFGVVSSSAVQHPAHNSNSPPWVFILYALVGTTSSQ